MSIISRIFNTRQRRLTLYMFIIYYMAFFSISAVDASPFDFLNLTAESMAVFQFVSLIVTISGGFVTIGFALKNDAKNQFKEQNEKISKVDAKIDTKAEEIKDEMHDMERRICDNVALKTGYLAEAIEEKVQAAKLLEDERVGSLKHRLDKVEASEQK